MGKRKRTVVKVTTRGPVLVDMTEEGGFLRTDYAERLRADLEKSAKKEKRREKRWQLAEKLWRVAPTTVFWATIFVIVFMVMAVINAKYGYGLIGYYINTTVVEIAEIVAIVFVGTLIAQIVTALILERS